MSKTDSVAVKLFIGIGVLAAISGIYLIFQQDYIGGISGSIVGIFLVFLNIKGNKSKHDELDNYHS